MKERRVSGEDGVISGQTTRLNQSDVTSDGPGGRTETQYCIGSGTITRELMHGN